MIIYDKSGAKVLDVVVNDDSYRYKAIMGDNNVVITFELAEYVAIPLGAYITFRGEKYTLARPENITMQHSRLFEYSVTFEGAEYKLKMWKMRNTIDGRLKFSLTAKAHEHLEMLVDNLNNREGKELWSVGKVLVKDSNEHLVTYDHIYCYEALNQIAEEFDTEFEIDNYTISLRKVETNKNNPVALAYGKGKGFKGGIVRSNTDDKLPIEVLFVQGGGQNIDYSKYGARQLHLPIGQTISYDGEHFEDESGYNYNTIREYKTSADGYSIQRADKSITTGAEDSLDCSDIYPKRVGEVTEVIVVDKEKNLYDIIDDTISEELNYEDYLIEGESMTIIFQSGELAGREFDVNYKHKKRRFEIVPQEMDGYWMPSDTFVPKVGDTYAIFNCALPDSYIVDNTTKEGAEWDMFRTAVKYLYDNEDEKFTFTGELDGIWTKKNYLDINNRLILGGYVSFSDERFQKTNVLVRIVGFKEYINTPYSPEIELSNTTISPSVSSTLKKLESQEVVIDNSLKSSKQFTQRRFNDAKQTMQALSEIQDSLSTQFENAITPISVQTMMTLIGDESLQFRFVKSLVDSTEVEYSIVWDDENKSLFAHHGYLQHLTLGINEISTTHDYKVWEMAQFDSGSIDSSYDKLYFYASVQRTEDYGKYLLSKEPLLMEQDDDVYYLLVGILNAESEGSRSFVTMYGFTEILPGRITTDDIVSADGNTYFNLKDGIIGGNIYFRNSKGAYISMSNMDYLRNAFKDDATNISGGVVVSSFMGVRDSNGDIVSAMAGKSPVDTIEDYPLIVAGLKSEGNHYYAWTNSDNETFYTLEKPATPSVSGETIIAYYNALGQELGMAVVRFVTDTSTSLLVPYLTINSVKYDVDSSKNLNTNTDSYCNVDNAAFRVYNDGTVIAKKFISQGFEKVEFYDLNMGDTGMFDLPATEHKNIKITSTANGFMAYLRHNSEDISGYTAMIFNNSEVDGYISICNSQTCTAVEIKSKEVLDFINIDGEWRKK